MWQMFGDRLSGVDSVKVENAFFPLTKPVAVNTGMAIQQMSLHSTLEVNKYILYRIFWSQSSHICRKWPKMTAASEAMLF